MHEVDTVALAASLLFTHGQTTEMTVVTGQQLGRTLGVAVRVLPHWDELVVETKEGRMHRLIAVDGKPLSSSEQAAEDRRITYLVNHPADFRREAQGRKDDEARMADLLQELPKL